MSGMSAIITNFFANPAVLGDVFTAEALETVAQEGGLHDLAAMAAACREAAAFGDQSQVEALGLAIGAELQSQHTHWSELKFKFGLCFPLPRPTLFGEKAQIFPRPSPMQMRAEVGMAGVGHGGPVRNQPKTKMAAAGAFVGPGDRLSAEEREFLNKVYVEYPSLHAALCKRTSWTDRQKLQILKNRARDLSSLESILEVFDKTDWSEEQQYKLLARLVENVEGWLAPVAGRFPLTLDLLLLFGFSQDEIYTLISLMAEAKGSNLTYAFSLFPPQVKDISLLGEDHTARRAFLFSLIRKARGQVGFASALVGSSSLAFSPEEERETCRRRVLRLLDVLTDYNRDPVLRLLTIAHGGGIDRFGPDYFGGHFELYVRLAERWPRLTVPVLEGVIHAENSGLIPLQITPETEQSVFDFVENTNGFVPVVYRAYLKEGQKALDRLKDYARRIITEDPSLEEVRRIIEENREYSGKEFLLTAIQKASPTSGASFVGQGFHVQLLEKILESGDLRHHILPAWRGRLKEFQLKRVAWRPKAGEVIDPEGQIKELLDQFRVGEEGKVKPEDLVEALAVYLRSSRSAADQKRLRRVLYAHAGSQDALREKIDRIQGADYAALELLDQLFRDKDNLVVLLREALAKAPLELLRGKGTQTQWAAPIQNPSGLALQLRLMWADESIPEARRRAILASVLRRRREAEIRKVILARDDIQGSALAWAITAVLEEAPALSKQEVIDEILLPPLQMIETEKAKFAYQEGEPMRIGLRAVKGPAFGLFGLTAGVCTADDLELWRNPKFNLMAILDLDANEAVGYVQMFEAVDAEGRRILTLPGINPSSEFMAEVEVQELYDNLIEGIIAFAQEAGFAGVYIPADSNIHSNRSGIQKVIAAKTYAKKAIPEVHWNTIPKPYPFQEVFVVWEK